MKTLEDKLEARLNAIDKEIEEGADEKRLRALKRRVHRILREIDEYFIYGKMSEIQVRAIYTYESIKEFLEESK